MVNNIIINSWILIREVAVLIHKNPKFSFWWKSEETSGDKQIRENKKSGKIPLFFVRDLMRSRQVGDPKQICKEATSLLASADGIASLTFSLIKFLINLLVFSFSLLNPGQACNWCDLTPVASFTWASVTDVAFQVR